MNKQNLKICIKIFKNFEEKNLKLQNFYNASKTDVRVIFKIKSRFLSTIKRWMYKFNFLIYINLF